MIKPSSKLGIADKIGPKFGINDKSPVSNPSVKASGTPSIDNPIHVSTPIKSIEPALPISHHHNVSLIASKISAALSRALIGNNLIKPLM